MQNVRSRRRRSAALAALVVAVSLATTPATAAGKGEACARLSDVIRQAVDQIVAGDQTARLQTALEAHTRLNCPVDALLNALRIPTIGEDGETSESSIRRDSDTTGQ